MLDFFKEIAVILITQLLIINGVAFDQNFSTTSRTPSKNPPQKEVGSKIKSKKQPSSTPWGGGSTNSEVAQSENTPESNANQQNENTNQPPNNEAENHLPNTPPNEQNNPDTPLPKQETKNENPENPNQPQTFILTNYADQRPEKWRDTFYGTKIETEGNLTYCRMQGNSYNRCGVATNVREIDYGIGARHFKGIRFTVKNLKDKEYQLKSQLRASWFDSDWSYALNSGQALVQTPNPIDFGRLKATEIRNFDLKWDDLVFPNFDYQKDFLAGIALRAGQEDLGIIKIELYGGESAQPEFIRTPHTGGYMLYKKEDGAVTRYETFDGESWGQPFKGVNLKPGDIIEVYGVINAGTIIGYDHGTPENPITIRGMTADAAFDLKDAPRKGQNGGIITLYGNYYLIENLEFRNCGLGYGGDENAAAFHTTTENSIFRNLKVHNCGNGWLLGGKNNFIENSNIFNNGYFESGYTHNIYVSRGSAHIIRNNSIHHSGGQNIKVRGWSVVIEYNLVYYAGNFDVDFPGSDENPGGGRSIFRGNIVVKSNYSDNQSQLFTFFEDGGAPNAGNKEDQLIAVNNTFIGPNNPNTAIFRIGKNKQIESYNNIFSKVSKIQMIGDTDREKGVLKGSHNLIPENAQNLGELVNSIQGSDPRLTELFIPANDSPAINQGLNSAPEIPLKEYNWPERSKTRCADEQIDLGAKEHQSDNCQQASQPPLCEELWQCAEWGACQENGKKYRSCSDLNKCSTERNKPSTEEACQYVCQDETIILGKNYSPPTYTQVFQSGLRQSYEALGYDTNDNKIDSTRRYNLKFAEIEKYIPQNKVLKKAELKVLLYEQYTPATIGFYQLLEDWEGEGHASWKYRQGADTNTGKKSTLPKIEWQTPGGTTLNQPLATYDIENSTRNYRLEPSFDITEIVKKWLAPEPKEHNFGIQIRAENATVINDLFGINYWRGDTEYYGPKLILQFGCE